MSVFLASTNDLIQVITGNAVSLDVYASYIDLNSSTNAVTPGRKNTKITTATTTTIVDAPASGLVRKTKSIFIKNIDGYDSNDGYGYGTGDGYSCNVTVQHTDGSTIVQLDKRNLGPGDSIVIGDDFDRIPTPSDFITNVYPSYYGHVAGAFGDGDPGKLVAMVETNGVTTPTPSEMGRNARCCFFKLPANLTVAKIRFYGITAFTSYYHVAIYRYSDLTRLTDDISLTFSASNWGSTTLGTPITLDKNILYFIACTTDTNSIGAGITCLSTSVTGTLGNGRILTSPLSLPGSLNPKFGHINTYCFALTTSDGTMPATATDLIYQANWTGGMPAFWLDSV
jgi:hypothetical protein